MSDGRSFSADLSAFRAKLGDRSEKLTQQVAVVLSNNIISGGNYSPGTPIDTGFARSHWTASIGAPASGTPNNASAVAVQFKPGQVYFLSNDAEYIRALEFGRPAGRHFHAGPRPANAVAEDGTPYPRTTPSGHSSQAPNGFIRSACEAIQHIVDEVAANIIGGAT